MSKFVPTLFISVGATHAFFTLRETYEHEIYIRGEGPMGGAVVNGVYQGHVLKEIRSFHHFNLSQTAEEAFSKAQSYAKEMGLKLTSTLEGIQQELRDIKRASAEELAAREAKYVEMRRLDEERREMFQKQLFSQAEEGVFPVGRYRGEKFQDVPKSYILWMIKKRNEFEEGSLFQFIANQLAVIFENLTNLPVPNKEGHSGEVKKRQFFDVTVIESFQYQSYDWAGRPCMSVIVKMVDEKNNLLVSFSNAFYPEVGETLKIKATVKEHGCRDGQDQTIVNRIAVE